MIGLALASLLFAASGPSPSHFVDPFDTYMDGVKSRTPSLYISKFANECGVPVSGVRSKYALGRSSTWSQVPDLSKAVYELESDYFSTLQVWTSDRRTLVLTWSYDMEQEYASMYCFGEDGRLKFEEVKAWIFELPSGRGWSYVRRWSLDSAGNPKGGRGQFMGINGTPIIPPKLDPEEAREIDFHGDTRKIQDLKLPTTMLP